ncbi:MAG: hypothetical protein AAF512_10840, partial [Pseudomonadota bacterium]
HILSSDEKDAKWQFAAYLVYSKLETDTLEKALLELFENSDEYTSRRALGSLGVLKSTHAEAACEKAWNTGHQYQRMMALSVLYEIGSEGLPGYLKLAEEDGRKYIVQRANGIKNTLK